MADSDEDWDKKDWDNFKIDVKPEKNEQISDNWQNTNAEADMFNLMSATSSNNGGHYSSALKLQQKDNNSARKVNAKADKLLYNQKDFVQKLPISKLASIAGQSPVKALLEIVTHQAEIIETMNGNKVTERVCELLLIIVFRMCDSPFVEHKQMFLEEASTLLAFWQQVKKYLEKKNAVDLSELNNQLLTIINALAEGKLEPKVKNVLCSICTQMKGDAWISLKEKLNKPTETSQLNIIPTKGDLLSPEPCLAPNIVKGQFPSIEQYKSLHLRLLKEDFVASIRESLEVLQGLSDDKTGRVDNIRIHRGVMLKHGPLNKQFPMNQSIYIDLKQTEENITKSKRFMMGSLLIFTTDPKTLDNMILALVQRQTEDMEEGIVPIEIVYCERAKIFSMKVIMIEVEVFFEAYHHVFNVLARSEIPFKEYIAFITTQTRLPKYIDRLANVNYSHRGKTFNVTSPADELPKLKGMNDSQLEAYYAALQREFCLIQGPPGTGKTFIGIEILKTLLNNTDERILIVCYTNRALDEVLTGLLNVTRDFVRLGSQSKNLKLDEFNIKELKNDEDSDRTLQGLFYKARVEYSRLMRLYIEIQKSDEEVDDVKVVDLLDRLHSVSRQIEELQQFRQYQLIKDKRVIGMTTTFAARSQCLLELLAIPIVVIEEAGEILEAHIVATLTRHTEQVVLIGDHYQLKPTTSVYRLAKTYKMDISLFERMVNNRIGCFTLDSQHRMRPEISDLIRETIYPYLHDDRSVKNYPDVLGMSKNLFFINHSQPESTQSEETTKTNTYEAEFLIQLAKFLIASGHKPQQITILAPYLGQFNLIKGLLHKSRLAGIQTVVVDNFQGEENDIILLSLVRSNSNGIIGYLGMKNRICVALSRAKIGLYIIGNMDMLAKANSKWKAVEQKLKATDCIGSEFNVTVNGSSYTIKSPKDIEDLLT